MWIFAPNCLKQRNKQKDRCPLSAALSPHHPHSFFFSFLFFPFFPFSPDFAPRQTLPRNDRLIVLKTTLSTPQTPIQSTQTHSFSSLHKPACPSFLPPAHESVRKPPVLLRTPLLSSCLQTLLSQKYINA